MIDARIIGGTSYAHLFENPNANVERWVYWSFGLEIEEDQKASVSRDWFRFDPAPKPLRETARATSASHPDAEASVYIWSHEWIDTWSLMIDWMGSGYTVAARVEVPALTEDGETRVSHVDQSVDVPFGGLSLTKGSVSEDPRTEQQVQDVLQPFLDREDFDVRDEGWRFVMTPS